MDKDENTLSKKSFKDQNKVLFSFRFNDIDAIRMITLGMTMYVDGYVGLKIKNT